MSNVIRLSEVAKKEYDYWKKQDKKTYKKINRLFMSIKETPFLKCKREKILLHFCLTCSKIFIIKLIVYKEVSNEKNTSKNTKSN